MGIIAQKDGFVQMYIAKIQPEPAKMPILRLITISSGEVGFGSDQTRSHFTGEKDDSKNPPF